MKYYDNKMWLRLQDLIDWGIPEVSLRRHRLDLEVLEDGGVFMNYDSLRPSWKAQITEALGMQPMAAYQYLVIERGMYLKDEDRDVLRRYTLPDGTKLSESSIEACQQACSFLSWVSKGKEDLSKLALVKISEFWLVCRAFVAYKNLVLPTSRKLENKWAEYCQFGAEAVIPKRFGTRNAAKMLELHIQLLIELMADGRKFSKREVIRQFRTIAGEKGWQEVASISDATLYRYIDQNRGQWELGRHGDKFHMLNRELSINQRRTSQPNLQWQADGTPAALWYRNENGQLSKLYVLVIMDSHSMAIVGYAIGQSEQTTLVAEALKMALKTQSKKPWELRTDKGSAFSSGETRSLLANLGISWKPTSTGRARAKSVEVMQNWWMKRATGYFENKSGMNLTVKTEDGKQNPDYLKANLDKLPNSQELAGQIRQSLAMWNNTKGEDGRSPAERLGDAAPQARDFEAASLVEQFGLWRKRGKKLTRYQFKMEGLEFQVGGQVFRYLPFAETAKAQAALLQKLMFTQVFYVKYDPTDIEQIALYILPDGAKEEEGNLRFWGYGELKQLSAQMLAEASESERKAFHKQREIQKQQKAWVLEQAESRKRVLEAANILSGGIEYQKVHKEASNKAKLELQRLQALGYEGLGLGAGQEIDEWAGKEGAKKPLKSLNIYKDRYKD